MDSDIDPIKLIAGIVKFFQNAHHLVNTNSSHSIKYEAKFNHTIGKLYDRPGAHRGRYLKIIVEEEKDPQFTNNFDFYVVTVCVNKHQQLNVHNGHHSETNPDQTINFKSVLQ